MNRYRLEEADSIDPILTQLNKIKQNISYKWKEETIESKNFDKFIEASINEWKKNPTAIFKKTIKWQTFIFWEIHDNAVTKNWRHWYFSMQDWNIYIDMSSIAQYHTSEFYSNIVYWFWMNIWEADDFIAALMKQEFDHSQKFKKHIGKPNSYFKSKGRKQQLVVWETQWDVLTIKQPWISDAYVLKFLFHIFDIPNTTQYSLTKHIMIQYMINAVDDNWNIFYTGILQDIKTLKKEFETLNKDKDINTSAHKNNFMKSFLETHKWVIPFLVRMLKDLDDEKVQNIFNSLGPTIQNQLVWF